jgi:hypothetical protein
MEVPHQYPYHPRLWSILELFGCGFLWIAGDWLPRGHIPTGFSLCFSLIGLIPIAFAFIICARRIWVERHLVLDNDSMVLPVGLFEMRTAKIEYTSVRRVWRHYLYYTFVLKVATEEQTFKIVPAFLPGNESYRALEEFLTRKALENTTEKKVARN